MRIMFVITGLGMGGAERQVCDLADKLSELGHTVAIITLVDNHSVLPHQQGVEIIPLKMNKTITSFVQALFKARKIIKQYQPDVIHSHMVHANIFSRLLRLVTQIPYLICTAHNTNEGGKIRMLAYRLTDFLCDLTTNVSQEAVDCFINKKAVAKNKIRLMYNGININNFKFSPQNRKLIRDELGIQDEFLFLAVGRLTAQKDYPNLIHAFNLLNEPNAKLAIVGDGDLRTEIHTLASNSPLAQNIHFLGIRKDIPMVLSAADAYVMSSAYEGFPLSIIEAMANGKVIITTDCGGVKEALGTAGFLVSPQNAEALAVKMKEVLTLSDSQRNIIGNNALTRVSELFSMESIVDQWLAIYQRKIQ
ncbi:glycosyltransferase [Lonepinella sp. BR2930]|uniref:glycosyltransferase n=1 Tax=Lonepinella sp. BR2930 TaxID=3434554 RepID=UPI003F6DC7E2